MEIEFQQAIPVLETLHEHGYEGYFVGGSVRDHLLHRQIHDVDIATSATPAEVMTIFPKHVPVALQHGTVLVFHQKIGYEVTTFRTESTYKDFRRPSDVRFVRSLEEDMKRRDFTMNAIAMIATGEIIDLFNGTEDISKKMIRTVGKASERFSEDALRMMRGIRFVSTLGFSLEEETCVAILKQAPLLTHISVERITAEFEKLLMGDYIQNVYSLFVATGLGKYLPNMATYERKLVLLEAYDMGSLKRLVERWSLLLLGLEIEDIANFLKAWRLPTKQVKETVRIVAEVKKLQEESWTNLKMYELGEELIVSIEKVHSVYRKEASQHEQLFQRYQQLPIKNKKELVITGKDLLQWLDRKGGAWVTAYIQQIETEIIKGTLQNNRTDIKEAVLSWGK